MRSEIKNYTYSNGDVQRVQLVRWDDWSALDFLEMPYAENALTCFSNIYRNFLVPSAPWLFGNMIMFHIPADVEVPFSFQTNRFGVVADPLTAAAAAIREGVQIRNGKPVFRNEAVRAFWQVLEERNSLQIISGKLPTTTVIPLGDCPGYMTETETKAQMKVNANFFIMDRFDCATVYDQVGTPFGLCVKDGFVSRPPLYHREALLVKENGNVTVSPMDVRELEIEINGEIFLHGKKCHDFHSPRPPANPQG